MRSFAEKEHPIAELGCKAKRDEVKGDPKRIATFEGDRLCTARHVKRAAAHDALHRNVHLDYRCRQHGSEALLHPNRTDQTAIREDFKRHRLA
jgi:hypothetical protein